MVSVIRTRSVAGPKRAAVQEKPVVERRATRSQRSSKSGRSAAAASSRKKSKADDDIEKKTEAAHVTRSVTAARAKPPVAPHITRSVTAKAKGVVGAEKAEKGTKSNPPQAKQKKSGPGKTMSTRSSGHIEDIAVEPRKPTASGTGKLMDTVKRRVARKSHKHGVKMRRPGCDLPLCRAKAKILDSSTSTCRSYAAKSADDSSSFQDVAAITEAAAAAAPTRSESSASSPKANLSPSLTNVLKILRTDSDETNSSNLFEDDQDHSVGAKSEKKTKDSSDARGGQSSSQFAEASSSVAFVTPSPYVNPSEEDIFVQPGRSSPESGSDDPSKVASREQKKPASARDEDRQKGLAESSKKSPAEQELDIATDRVMAAQKAGWLLPPVDMAAAAANPQSEDSPSSEIGTTSLQAQNQLQQQQLQQQMGASPPASAASVCKQGESSAEPVVAKPNEVDTSFAPNEDNKKAAKGSTANVAGNRVREKQAKLNRAKRIAKERVENEHRLNAAASTSTTKAKAKADQNGTSEKSSPHAGDVIAVHANAAKGAAAASNTQNRATEKQAKLIRAKQIAKKQLEKEYRQKTASTAPNEESASNSSTASSATAADSESLPAAAAAAAASSISTANDSSVPSITKDCVLQNADGSWSAYVLKNGQTYGLGPFVKREIASVALGSFQFYIQIESRSTNGVLTAEMLGQARKMAMHVMSLAQNDGAGRINWDEMHRLMYWNEMYRRLCTRRPKDGGAPGCDIDDPMYRWAQCQRRLFRSKDPSFTAEKKRLLDDINFDWDWNENQDDNANSLEAGVAAGSPDNTKKSDEQDPEGGAGSSDVSHLPAGFHRGPSSPTGHSSLRSPPPNRKKGAESNAKELPEEGWCCRKCEKENRGALKRCGSCYTYRPGFERAKRFAKVPAKSRSSLRKPKPPNQYAEPATKSKLNVRETNAHMSLRRRPARKTVSSAENAKANATNSASEKPPVAGKRPRGRPPKQLCLIEGCRDKVGVKCKGMCLVHFRESATNRSDGDDDSATHHHRKKPAGNDNGRDANDVFEFAANDTDDAKDPPANRKRTIRTRSRASNDDRGEDGNVPSKRPRRYLNGSGRFKERRRRASEKPHPDSEEDEEDIDGVKRQRSLAQVKARMYKVQASGYRAEMEVQEDVNKERQRVERRRLEKSKEESSKKDAELDDKDRLLEIIKSLLPDEEDVKASKRGNIRSIRELLDDADVRDS